MKRKPYISALLFALVMLTAAISRAEAPCLHIGQESLKQAAMCVRYARATGQLNNDATYTYLVNSPMVVPQTIPMISVPSMLPLINYGATAYPYAWRNAHLMYPNSMGIYNSFYRGW